MPEDCTFEEILGLFFTVVGDISFRVAVQLGLRIRKQETIYILRTATSLNLLESLEEPFYGRLLSLHFMLLMGLLGNGLHVLLVKYLESLRIPQAENLLA